MANHPNRSRRKDAPGRTPKPDEIRRAREDAGLSRKDAARLVKSSVRGLEKWELGERRIHPGLWELLSIKLPIAGRLHRKFTIAPNGCWMWSASQNQSGYGQMHYINGVALAHRISYELYVEMIPEADGYHGTVVCHRCDNKLCVNPDHLFVGSQSDNLRDAVRKKRFGGERTGTSKLTEDQVAEIRADHREHKEIAQDYGISRSHVGAIKSGKWWKSA